MVDRQKLSWTVPTDVVGDAANGPTVAALADAPTGLPSH